MSQAHVVTLVSSCFAIIRRICSIHRSVTRSALQSLIGQSQGWYCNHSSVIHQVSTAIIHQSVIRPVLQSLVDSLVLTRLDYNSTNFAGLPCQLLDRLQSVMNTTVRLVFSAWKYNYVTPLYSDLRWLRALQRINYRLAVLAFHCQHGMAPSYLSLELRRASDVVSGRHLQSSTMALVLPRTKRSTIGYHAFSVVATKVQKSVTGCYPIIFTV